MATEQDALAPPRILQVDAREVEASPEVARLVDDLRARADGFVFLSGGASHMSEADRSRLLELFGALADLDRRGVRFAVGDGGTKAGIMEAAGLVRRQTDGAFPLLGIAPAPDISLGEEPGKTPVDPGHSEVVAVTDRDWVEAQRAKGWKPESGHWGSETETMFRLFGRLAAGRPSVAVVANGGGITLDEVSHHMAQRRPIVVVQGSGRAADAIVALLEGTEPASEDARALLARARALGVAAKRESFVLFPLDAGRSALADRLAALLARD